jgi:hypothetical protein
MNPDLSIEQHLRELEERLLQTEVRRSADDVTALLADDFIEFGSSGRVFDKQQIIDNLQTEPRIRQSLVDFKTLPLAPGLVLATYRAVRQGGPGEPPSYSLRSSIWKLIDDRWQLVFHQGTLSKER